MHFEYRMRAFIHKYGSGTQTPSVLTEDFEPSGYGQTSGSNRHIAKEMASIPVPAPLLTTPAMATSCRAADSYLREQAIKLANQ
jgi:hypothetical protein